MPAIRVAREVASLHSGSAMKALPGATQLRDDGGELRGYICPGCNKELSISGWSRHKKTCNVYVASIASHNGTGERIN